MLQNPETDEGPAVTAGPSSCRTSVHHDGRGALLVLFVVEQV
jgi:hypothetical protein